MRVLVSSVAILTFAAYCGAAQAELIASDSFAVSEGGNDYALGSMGGQNPSVGLSGFSTPWNTGTNACVASRGGLQHKLTPDAPREGLVVPYSYDTGWANRRISRQIDYAPVDGSYYMSVLLQKDHVKNGDLAAGLTPYQSTSWSFSNIQGAYVGLQEGNIAFLTTSYIDTLVPSAQVNIGETYFALLQFDYDTSGPDVVTATIYDASATEVASRAYSGLDLDGDIGRFGLITSDLVPTAMLDEWRFGVALTDVMVTEAVPTPASLWLAALACSAVGLARRSGNRS